VIAGATANLYTIPNVPLSASGTKFRAIAINSQGQSNPSAAATLTVTSPPPPGSPATLSNGGPTGTLDSTITQVSLSVNTNVSATCKYDSVPGKAYSAMANTFATTGSTRHVQPLTVMSGQSYAYYVRCDAGNGGLNTSDYPISFGIGVPPPASGPTVAGAALHVQVYPNPWRSDKHGTHPMTFAGLTTGTTIKIFTTSGRLVKTLGAQGSGLGNLDWDLTNDKGDKVASGVYLYLITDAAGDKVKGKMAVIR
jgi:hypothetical protein